MVPVVETVAGRVRGDSQGPVRRFLGVPYAAAPVGDDRLRPPRPPTPWVGVRDGTRPGPWAPQLPSLGSLVAGEAVHQGEACLSLNVWTPALDGRRPVVVFVHGGGFVEGSGAAAIYNGARLAHRGDVVVVTCNYRLGLLGFAAHPDLRDDDTGAAGNWGLLDQVAALSWVQGHIDRFGGDPGHVTVVGHSSGAMSVCDLLAAPAAAGLFARAVAQSGGPSVRSLPDAVDVLDWVLGRLGLGDAAKLRHVPVDALLDAQRALAAAGDRSATRPVVDGSVVPDHPLDAATLPVPLLIGTTRDEVRMFYAGTPILAALSERALLSRVAASVGRDRALAAIERYRGAFPDHTPGELLVAIDTDLTLRAPALRLAAAHARRAPETFVYRFDVAAADPERGACHGIDLPFVLGNRVGNPAGEWVAWDADLAALADDVQDAWLAFARGEHMSLRGVPWPRFDGAGRATLVVDRTPAAVALDDNDPATTWTEEEVRW